MQMRTINRYIAARCRDPLHMLELGTPTFTTALGKWMILVSSHRETAKQPDHEHWQAGQKTGGASLKQQR